MIRLIAALDTQRGIAKNGQIPWTLPKDKAHFRELTLSYGANVIMGRKTYETMPDHLVGRNNYIVSRSKLALPPNCMLVNDLEQFLTNFSQDIWIIGGEQLYKLTIARADELYLTLIDGVFNCDQFFPDYQKSFKLVSSDGPYKDNNLKFYYQLLSRK